jgi:hypothetical protein
MMPVQRAVKKRQAGRDELRLVLDGTSGQGASPATLRVAMRAGELGPTILISGNAA